MARAFQRFLTCSSFIGQSTDGIRTLTRNDCETITQRISCIAPLLSRQSMPIKLPLSLRRQRITGKEDKTQQQQQPFPLDTLNTQRLGGAEPLPLLSEHDSSSSAAAAVVAQQLHTTAQPENTSINVPSTESEISSTPTGNKKTREPHQIRLKRFRFYQGGVRPCHAKLVRIIGRCGFVAKGVVYGIIGVLIITNVTGDYTPNGSEGNESPQVYRIKRRRRPM